MYILVGVIATWKEVTKMMRSILMRVTEKKKTVIAATAITTLISATAAFAAIKAKKASTSNDDVTREEENIEFISILDDLVKDGTITQAQEDAIQIAIARANESETANSNFMEVENDEFTTVPSSSKTAFIRLKKTLLKVGSQQLKKPSREMAVLLEKRAMDF